MRKATLHSRHSSRATTPTTTTTTITTSMSASAKMKDSLTVSVGMAGDRSPIKDMTTSGHSSPSNNNKINTNGHAPPSKDKLKMSVEDGGTCPILQRQDGEGGSSPPRWAGARYVGRFLYIRRLLCKLFVFFVYYNYLYQIYYLLWVFNGWAS